MLKEEWRNVVDRPGYQVSNYGQVRNIKRGNIIAQYTLDTGHQRLKLGRGHTRYVHTLVIEAFIGPRPTPTHQCRHLDGNASNNYVANLAWGTPKENSQDALRHGTNAMVNRTHCPRGHEYNETNTGHTKRGSRICRACARENVAARRAAQRAADPIAYAESRRREHKNYRDKKKSPTLRGV